MAEMRLRHMVERDWEEVAELIALSTNSWYEAHAMPPIFPAGAAAARLFCEVYEALDPGCCILAEKSSDGRILGSCFYHPRPTHISLGIMNVHPASFGAGVAGALLRFITSRADAADLPVRLVSSALNLDSFSLYSRAGFTPRIIYQDMFLDPQRGSVAPDIGKGLALRLATREDIPHIVALERTLLGIEREKDFHHFLENRSGIWRGLVHSDSRGDIAGFLFSVEHAGSNMLGPGLARTEDQALALILAALAAHQHPRPVFLVPARCHTLVRRLYAAGARNCELHFGQVRGPAATFGGVSMPSFMPESG